MKLKRVNKYNNKTAYAGSIKFHSIKERDHYLYLKDLEKKGLIYCLELQPVYELKINGVKICKYIADFTYKVMATHDRKVVDVKGYKTAIYKLKAKMFRAIYPEFIFEEV